MYIVPQTRSPQLTSGELVETLDAALKMALMLICTGMTLALVVHFQLSAMFIGRKGALLK